MVGTENDVHNTQMFIFTCKFELFASSIPQPFKIFVNERSKIFRFFVHLRIGSTENKTYIILLNICIDNETNNK